MRAVGIDISHWQGTFKNLGNIDFIIVKATEGWGYVDPEFEDYLPEVMTVPVRGAYHYFRTEYDPVAQVENFLEATDGKGFHFLAVDYEELNNILDQDGEANLRTFWDNLNELTSHKVLLYTSPYIYRDNLCFHNTFWETVPLWMAHYSTQNPQTGTPMIFDGAGWLLWQYTNVGKGGDYGVGSKKVDLNVFNGTVKKMQTFIKEFEMKKFYTSKTLWFNVIGVLFLWILPAIFPDFVLAVPPAWQAFREPVILVVNLILRVFTNKGIEA